jgi:hypothetical protein
MPVKLGSNKYLNRKVMVDGILFDSKKEAEFYIVLKADKKAGKIKDFEVQPEFILQEGFTKNGKRYQPIKYIADFKVTHNDESVEVIDIKGVITKEFAIKRKLFEARYPDLSLKII